MADLIHNGVLITGTDTEVGKTMLTIALVAYWKQYFPQHRLGVMKPIQAGVGDFETYTRLFDLDQSPESITPQRFSAPLAPPIAAALEGRSIDLAMVWQQLTMLLAERQFVLVEGVGGLGSPITEEWAIADLAAAWRLPIVLVVPVRLGAICQAVANVALARQHQLVIKGIVLNCTQAVTEEAQQSWAPPQLIERMTQVPILGTLPYVKDWNNLDALSKAAATLSLEAIWGNLA